MNEEEKQKGRSDRCGERRNWDKRKRMEKGVMERRNESRREKMREKEREGEDIASEYVGDVST